MKYRLRRISLVLILVFATTASGQDTETTSSKGTVETSHGEIPVIPLTLEPADEPVPALKYALLPQLGEQRPGNAVPYYYRAVLEFLQWEKSLDEDFYQDYETWMDNPPADLPRRKVQKALTRFDTTFSALRIAAYREKCDWDWRMRDLKGIEAIAFTFRESQAARRLARFLALKCRLEIAERRYDDAIETMQIGYKLVQDIAKPPTLINDLIGVAVASLLNEQLQQLIDSPGSPNLYWALTELPTPFIDMRPAMRFEMLLPEKILTILEAPDSASRSIEEWRKLLIDSYGILFEYGPEDLGLDSSSDWQVQLAAIALVMKGYPAAKRALIENGYDREQVDRMPVGQVIAIQTARITRYMYDEVLKWMFLPYAEAWPRMKPWKETMYHKGYFGSLGHSQGFIPIGPIMLPGATGALVASALVDQRIAVLRVIEAIRMHAARNNGQLPQSLDEISVVPIPTDPATGKPFPYRLEDGKAILDFPETENQPVRENRRRYVITIEQPSSSAQR